MRIRKLSYDLDQIVPGYGARGFDLEPYYKKSIKKGDSCNEYIFKLGSHVGTHVDCPAHFFLNGKKTVEYSPEQWVFSNPQSVSVRLSPGEILKKGPWLKTIRKATDILLIKSGWGSKRMRAEYGQLNPGIHSEVGDYLRRFNPSIRMIGIDWISISSFQHRELGRQCHRAFLNPRGAGHPIRIIEDMDLRYNLTRIRKVWVAPLFLSFSDSAPVTVFGEFA